MRRREFITFLGGATVASYVGARAQQARMPVIGYLVFGSAGVGPDRLRSFRQGLAETGIVEGRDATIEIRRAEFHTERLPKLADELVSLGINVLAAPGNTPAALAAKASTTTIPIVFFVGGDPVQLGLVASLSRPGGNITGVTNLTVEVGPKRLQLLHELMPSATVFALIVNPSTPLAQIESRDLLEAARVLGLELHVLKATSEDELDKVFSSLIQLHAAALLIATDGLFTARSERLAMLALRHAIPAISSNLEFAAAGGLISYGSSIDEPFRLAGVYTGRILKGEKPSDMPVQQSTKIELKINLKTAKALGLTVPPALLARADEVIE
ncbi:ABC transporter substrate-binding protein [Bradyrhizobium sp. UFLA05-153]|uniref:ABC transporter substrate-binding protein n=1 Tax=Bradyrhizobium sp. Ec3.3 TaxID=189753 RepID=UPI000417C409|nr:ABC transporter substrate-binding protein [Bradyrhizobium sp. Ec3.3]